MYKFKCKKLSSTDESSIVFIGETESQDSEEICEEKMDCQIGIGITDEVKPFVAGSSAV